MGMGMGMFVGVGVGVGVGLGLVSWLVTAEVGVGGNREDLNDKLKIGELVQFFSERSTPP